MLNLLNLLNLLVHLCHLCQLFNSLLLCFNSGGLSPGQAGNSFIISSCYFVNFVNFFRPLASFGILWHPCHQTPVLVTRSPSSLSFVSTQASSVVLLKNSETFLQPSRLDNFILILIIFIEGRQAGKTTPIIQTNAIIILLLCNQPINF